MNDKKIIKSNLLPINLLKNTINYYENKYFKKKCVMKRKVKNKLNYKYKEENHLYMGLFWYCRKKPGYGY